MKTETEGSRTGPTYANAKFSLYTVLVVFMVACMLISNIAASKGVILFPELSFTLGPIAIEGLNTDGAFFLFPLTYVIGDIISEVYGFKAMRRAVLLGFGVMALSAISLSITLALPTGTDEWSVNHQAAMEQVAGVVPLLFLAGVAGFVTGELINSYVLVKMKARTGEKGLVGRLVSSTVLGEFADTLAFGLIAAPVIGFTEPGEIINFIVVGFIWKTLIEIAVMPLTVMIINAIKKREPDYAPVPAS